MPVAALMLAQKIASGGGSPPAFTGLKAWSNANSSGGGSGGQNSTTTGSITTTVGRAMLAVIGGQAPGNTPSFSDSNGNSWTKIASLQNGTDATAVYLCPALTSAGAGHTFTVNWTDGWSSLAVLELDRGVTLDTSTTVTDPSTPWDSSITTGQPNCLIVAVTTVYATTGSWSLSATGWTFYGQLPDPSDSGDWDIGMMHKTAASAGVNNISMTGTDVDGSQSHHLIMASLY